MAIKYRKYIVFIVAFLLRCGTGMVQAQTAYKTAVPDFNAHNAYQYIAQQVAFGPRVPNSEAQNACARYLEQLLQTFTDTVFRQETIISAKNRKKLRCINLVGSFNPGAQRRLLLLAHWDSRPWADRNKKKKPVPAANDGASGVGVLLELAALLRQNGIDSTLGIDILFTDLEDYGKAEWGAESYGLGAQYWAHQPHVNGYQAFGGILLDMVGGKNARFPLEAYSMKYAPQLQSEVWEAAVTAGYASYFVPEKEGFITDDHVFINGIARIPCIDIIDLPDNSGTGFVDYWHTTDDDMRNIDVATLKAVGQTLVQYIYSL
ncbi:MAG: M28 family peptidase [Sphingobacteriales bacterium]|nr:MAG: M28 family peptidase [Sphingobacteriales bacterium]